MSRFVATSAIRGAARMVGEADVAVQGALERLGPDTPVAFTNTAYFLPVIYAFTGRKVEVLGDLPAVIERAKSLLHPVPTDSMWLPYLGETLDSGIATLFAQEALEGVRFAEGTEPQKIKLSGYQAGAARIGGDPSPFVHGAQALLTGSTALESAASTLAFGSGTAGLGSMANGGFGMLGSTGSSYFGTGTALSLGGGGGSYTTAAGNSVIDASSLGAAGSGERTGCEPARRMAAGVMPEYPSAPAGQMASPMRS